jgi:hypothetical protein
MPIFLIFLVVFIFLLRKQPKGRAYLVLAALTIYVVLIFAEQLYLEEAFNRSFHLSDPSNYFDAISKLSVNGLFTFISSDEYRSNQFYYILNWIFYNNFIDVTATAIMLKITNSLVFLLAYLLLPKPNKKIDYIDYLLLFHPYLFVMLIRNVRDVYIIFFMVLFIYGFEKWQLHRSQLHSYVPMAISFAFMLSIRPFFSVLMLLIPASQRVAHLSRLAKFTILSIAIISFGIVISSDALGIRSRLLSALFSTYSYHEGYDAEREDAVHDLMQGGEISGGLLFEYVKRILMGIPVFLFTPQPVNYGLKFLTEQKNGLWNIYTTFDNVLIVIGSIVNYLIAFPLLLKFFHHVRSIRIDFALTTIFMFLIYSVFQLGITDVRIKYSFLFFMLAGLKLTDLHKLNFKQDAKYFIGIVAIFFVVFVGAK